MGDRESRTDRVLMPSGEFAPVLENPPDLDYQSLSRGEKLLYRILQIRSAVRSSLPWWHKYIHGMRL